MPRTVRETLVETYDPDLRVMAIVAVGSPFLLVSFLLNPSSNPSYLFGLVVAALLLVVSVVVLAAETRRQPRWPEMTGGGWDR